MSEYQRTQQAISQREAFMAAALIAAAFGGAAAFSWKKSKVKGTFFAGAALLSLAAPVLMYGVPEFGKII